MDPTGPQSNGGRRGRDETRDERADRNWQELVQELRVTQTGTQILSGFLLTVAFQQSFHTLAGYQKTIYLCLVVLAAATTAVGLLPVALHRALFRRRRKEWLVTQGNRMLVLALTLVAALTSGVVFFLFDVVASLLAGIIAGIVVAIAMVVWLLVFPVSIRGAGSARIEDDEVLSARGSTGGGMHEAATGALDASASQRMPTPDIHEERG